MSISSSIVSIKEFQNQVMNLIFLKNKHLKILSSKST
jgi:hypothetical protein